MILEHTEQHITVVVYRQFFTLSYHSDLDQKKTKAYKKTPTAIKQKSQVVAFEWKDEVALFYFNTVFLYDMKLWWVNPG